MAGKYQVGVVLFAKTQQRQVARPLPEWNANENNWLLVSIRMMPNVVVKDTLANQQHLASWE